MLLKLLILCLVEIDETLFNQGQKLDGYIIIGLCLLHFIFFVKIIYIYIK